MESDVHAVLHSYVFVALHTAKLEIQSCCFLLQAFNDTLVLVAHRMCPVPRVYCTKSSAVILARTVPFSVPGTVHVVVLPAEFQTFQEPIEFTS